MKLSSTAWIVRHLAAAREPASAYRTRRLDDLQACVADHFPVSVEHSTFQFEKASHAQHEARQHD